MKKKTRTDRRSKRKRAIAKAIRNAEKKGLYDIAEHATSEIDLGPMPKEGKK
jgi:hypothetical protein